MRDLFLKKAPKQSVSDAGGDPDHYRVDGPYGLKSKNNHVSHD